MTGRGGVLTRRDNATDSEKRNSPASATVSAVTSPVMRRLTSTHITTPSTTAAAAAAIATFILIVQLPPTAANDNSAYAY